LKIDDTVLCVQDIEIALHAKMLNDMALRWTGAGSGFAEEADLHWRPLTTVQMSALSKSGHRFEVARRRF
jgi:hypothetical protein